MTHQEQFQQELKALLTKYGVAIAIEEDTHGYHSVPKINFFSYTQWDKDGIVVADSINFDIKYMDGK